MLNNKRVLEPAFSGRKIFARRREFFWIPRGGIRILQNTGSHLSGQTDGAQKRRQKILTGPRAPAIID